MLKVSIRLAPCHRSALHFIPISVVLLNVLNVSAKHKGKSVVLITRIKQREQSRLCFCRAVEGEKPKVNTRLFLKII